MKAAKKTIQNIQLIDTSTEVSQQEKTFLVHGTKKVPICAEVASKFSLFFRYLENQPLHDPDEPVNLLIRNNGQSVELGPCRILPDSETNGYAGRLVFLRDVYDIQRLFKNSKIDRLQSAFQDLPLIFERKAQIKPIFKTYVADLKYDLQVYKNLFDDLDIEYEDEPEEVKTAVQKAIIETEGPKYFQFFNDKLEELESLVENFSQEEHQCHGFYFRQQLWNLILCSPFGAQSVLKPRGYAGDSEMMKMIYLNTYQGDSTFAKLMHKHAMVIAPSKSVRNRMVLVAQKIKHSATESHITTHDKFKVLSVGSGAAFELKSIITSTQDCDRFQFALFDQDSTALSEASDVVSEIKKSLHKTPKVDFIQGSVRTMLFSRQLKQTWGQFHFIYSMGLFDYLTFRVARAVLERLYQLLQPGGELIIGNFHVSNPSKYYMEYWVDWVLFHRTEEEFRSLLDSRSPAQTAVLYDDTGSQMFLHIKKPN
jgi:extracellular factor (EF) 3-hydroxypalmitic acid methyl ester biosynthesis protein